MLCRADGPMCHTVVPILLQYADLCKGPHSLATVNGSHDLLLSLKLLPHLTPGRLSCCSCPPQPPLSNASASCRTWLGCSLCNVSVLMLLFIAKPWNTVLGAAAGRVSVAAGEAAVLLWLFPALQNCAGLCVVATGPASAAVLVRALLAQLGASTGQSCSSCMLKFRMLVLVCSHQGISSTCMSNSCLLVGTHACPPWRGVLTYADAACMQIVKYATSVPLDMC
jgi:hypothetical protein